MRLVVGVLGSLWACHIVHGATAWTNPSETMARGAKPTPTPTPTRTPRPRSTPRSIPRPAKTQGSHGERDRSLEPGKPQQTYQEAGYEIYDHPADAGVRGWGPSLGEAFANTACALFELITDTELVGPREEVCLDLVSPDREALLVDLLNELIALIDLRRILFREIRDPKISRTREGYRFTGKAVGEAYNPARHIARTEAKAATYSQLRVDRSSTRPAAARWIAQTIIDT